MKKIPYGIANYKTIRQEDYYYVDKTRYIPLFEATGKYLFLLRPRRFGKSSLLTVLECYYDLSRPHEFEMLFHGTDIAAHPTPEQNAHLILKFNFSQINPDPAKVEESFNGHAWNCFYFFGERYADILGPDYLRLVETHTTAHQQLEFTLRYVGMKGYQTYVLIDEYDNFTNTILATDGAAAYHEVTHGAGFLRFFFNVLKGAADQVDTGLARLFITGVSPVTLDDVTSGFNIGKNISLYPEFNTLLGFTETDVQALLTHYDIPAESVTQLLHTWYDHYGFAPTAQIPLYNTDMVWYFVDHYVRTGAPPDPLIDQNVRIDYVKLRHLVTLDRRLNGNFSALTDIIATQSVGYTPVETSFPAEKLTKPVNFISLLYYFGLLSYTPEGELRIPNETVRQLMYSYLREGYEDAQVFRLDMWHFAALMRALAYQGEWEPVFRFLAAEVERQTSIRDYLTGEKVIQTFLLAYLNVTDYYLTRTEVELGKGFVDLYLEPFTMKHPELTRGYLIELKYLARNAATPEAIQTQIAEAAVQLRRYAADPRVNQHPQLTCLALVFAGWELVAAVEVEMEK